MVARQAKTSISLLVTDLDNTLYDWVDIWYRSFRALLDEIVRISGVDEAVLKRQIRTIHQRRGTSEYSFLIQELPVLRELHGPEADLGELYDEAIHAYRSARLEALTPYPSVVETLTTIKRQGVRIAAYTESLAYYTQYRLRKLGLDGVIDVLYSPPDHDFPTGVNADELRKLPDDAYDLRFTRHEHTPIGVLKPDVTVLSAVVDQLGTTGHAAYVGDSLMKDVAMAQAVGVADVWAKYGAAQHRVEYALLREVSHWTEADVQQEKAITESPDVLPTYVLENSFAELLDIFDFEAA